MGGVKEFYVRRIGCLKIRPKQIRDRGKITFQFGCSDLRGYPIDMEDNTAL